MKTIFINASPRKTWNTAQLLKSAQKGAEDAGAETEYIDLYDLNFTGCRSCLACKRAEAERCKCFWKDDLSPLIDKILKADALIIGTPIYMGEPTAQFRALYERLGFCVLSYDEGVSYYKGKLNVGLIYTMNASKEFYEANMRKTLKNTEFFFGAFFGGEVRVYPSCDTLQVTDYSKYSMGMFDGEHKKAHREEQFPKDLEEAYNLGKELSI
ncbi:MAG: flavodoxin family protein [Firmicutes bacterium]|nr:flavodoxin family protein [Bacillota bacterium]MBR0105172.1 flavodoxin family protein [Bacillota bacterium]MBR2594381.1 flavodoxin family protein [Bacillota bacterium]